MSTTFGTPLIFSHSSSLSHSFNWASPYSFPTAAPNFTPVRPSSNDDGAHIERNQPVMWASPYSLPSKKKRKNGKYD